MILVSNALTLIQTLQNQPYLPIETASSWDQLFHGRSLAHKDRL